MTTSLQNQSRRVFPTNILPLMGYGLLLMAVINIGMSIAPLQLTNPLWKFQTGGQIIETTPFILLGMVLIYYGGDRSSVENAILKTLSWLSLVLAILLLSIIPLNISNSWHYQQQNIIPSDRIISQKNTIEQFKQQLEAAKSKTEIGTVLQQQVAAIDLSDLLNTQQLKDNILSELSSDRDTLVNSRTFQKNKHSTLFEKCLRWNLGALVAATLFFKFWQATTTRGKIK